MRTGDSFQDTVAGGAYSNHPMAAGFGCQDGINRGLGQVVILGMHQVVLDVVRLDGAEGAQSDMQRNLGYVDSLSAQTIQQFGCEMQAAVGAAAEPSSLA